MKAIARKMDMDETVNFDDYVPELDGFTGADLQSFLYNAHLNSIHEYMDSVAIEKDKSGKTGNDMQHPFTVLGTMSQQERDESHRFLMSLYEVQFESLGKKQSMSHDESKIKLCIQAKHLDKALTESKPSLNPTEKARFKRIFDRFQTTDLPSAPISSRATLG